MSRVILIGFMGAGKTTIGQALAEKRKAAFLDTDQRIEEMAGMTISRIFAEEGEEAFRRIETAVLKELLEGERDVVISTGGGLPLRRENQEMLKKLGTVIYLKVSENTVVKRLEGDTTRPLLQGSQVKERVERLLTEREPLYKEAAHVTVCVDERTVVDIVREIEERMGEQL